MPLRATRLDSARTLGNRECPSTTGRSEPQSHVVGDGFVAPIRDFGLPAKSGVGAIAGSAALGAAQTTHGTAKTPECWPPRVQHNPLECPRELVPRGSRHFLIRMSVAPFHAAALGRSHAGPVAIVTAHKYKCCVWQTILAPAEHWQADERAL